MKILLQLFLTFLKVGTFTFGGGLAMLPVIRNEVVNVRKWLDDEEITDCIAIAQSLPGVLSLNSSIYIGNRMKGIAGACCAAAGMILPAFVSILAILMFFGQIRDNAYVHGALEGIKAATVGLILGMVINMARVAVRGWIDAIIALVSFVMIVIFQITAILPILLGGLAGLIYYMIRKRRG